MKRILPLCVACMSAIFLCSCNNNYVNVKEAEFYLESTYQKDFTLLNNEDYQFDDDYSSDKLYTFSCEDGIICHVFLDFRSYMFSTSYSVSEDYQLNYQLEHPELFSAFDSCEYKFEHYVNDEPYTTSIYKIYIDSYEDIEDAERFAYDFVKNAAALDCIDVTMRDKDISTRTTQIQIYVDGEEYPLGSSYFTYPTQKTNASTLNIDEIISGAQQEYVRKVRNGEITDSLPDEVLEENPVPTIHDITLDGEIVLSYMSYDYDSECYRLDEYCRVSDSVELTTELLSSLLTGTGWTHTNSLAQIEWQKGDTTVTLKDKSKNIIFYKNGERYIPEAFRDENSYRNYMIVLNEHDLKELFGIEFEFDRINGTGKITEY